MKILLWVEIALASLGLAMTLSMGYVTIAYAIYSSSEPSMKAGLPGILTITVSFLLLTAFAGVACWALWKQRSWQWLSHGLLALSVPLLFKLVYANLGG